MNRIVELNDNMKRAASSINPSPALSLRLTAIILLLVLAFAACGKKGDPEPPSLVVPAAISSLKVTAEPGKSYLAWALPRKNSDGSRPADLAGFRVYLKTVPVGEDSCKFCDEGFKPYLELPVKNPGQGFVRGETFYLPVNWPDPGKINVFFVVSLNSRNWESQASNKIAVTFLPKPSPPVRVKCEVSASVVELQWQPSPVNVPAGTEIFYHVFRRKSSNLASPLRRITPEPISETSYIDVGLTDWRAYEYSVTELLVADQIARESGYSVPVKVVPGDYTPPSAVQNFMALCYLGGIQLVWDPAQDADLAGYRVYRLDTVKGTEISFTVPPAHHEYFDREIIRGRKYVYKVVSFDTSERHNESPPSPEVAISCNGSN